MIQFGFLIPPGGGNALVTRKRRTARRIMQAFKENLSASEA